MEPLISALLLGVTVAIAINADDLIYLMAFLSNPRFKFKQVILGEFIGVSTLILISYIISLLAVNIPLPWLGLMGFFPLFLGIRGLIKYEKRLPDEDPTKILEEHKNDPIGHIKILSVAAVSLANGGNNLGILVPIFAANSLYSIGLFIAVILIMTCIGGLISYKLVNHKHIRKRIMNYEHIILPFALMIVGILILIKCGTFSLFI